MNNTQEADRLTMKNGLTLIFQDSKARAQLAEMLADLMTKYGADNPPPYPVTSVNGMTGDVIVQGGGGGGEVLSVNGKVGVVELDAEDVGALPDTVTIPSKTSDLTNDSGFVNAAGAAAAAPVKSVNGQTGAVTVTVPTATSDLTNDSGFVDAAGAAAAAPVQSVNGQTGAVSLDAGDVGALPDTYVPPVTSVDGQTGDVTTMRVTDSGTTQDNSGATWNYRKWSNGDIDLWLTGLNSSSFTFSAAQTGPTNGMYRRIESRSFTILTDILWMTATGTNSCYFIAGIQKTGSNSFDIIQQGINGTTTNLWASIHIKGRWQ